MINESFPPATDRRPIRTALLSMHDKTGLVDFARGLANSGVRLIASGGTAAAIADAGIPVTPVEEVTGAKEMLGGRVKTLHPVLHGGILARPDAADDRALTDAQIGRIDLVAVSLYPFERAVAANRPEHEIIEMIDIGGPTLIRGAAKNFAACTIVTDPADYALVLASFPEGGPDLWLRQELARKAFRLIARYDAAIDAWFSGSGSGDGAADDMEVLRLIPGEPLRYGENPHQPATLLKPAARPATGLVAAEMLQGKALSYNNLLDADQALRAVALIGADRPAAVVVKHGNPCGAAAAPTIDQAVVKAFAADRKSAFGGIVAVNRPLTATAADALSGIFLEVVLAPALEDGAREILAKKKNLRVLICDPLDAAAGITRDLRSIAGGFLAQAPDPGPGDGADWTCVTDAKPDEETLADLRFAMAVAAGVRSNAIVLASGGVTCGIGAGQMSRIDAVDLAIRKQGDAPTPDRPPVLASDAFFPFGDSVTTAAKAGIRAIVQPGGSIRDEESVNAANAAGIPMLITGMRHFRH